MTDAFADVLSGARDTGMLLRLRVRMMRSLAVKIMLAVGVLLLLVSLFVAMNLGFAATLAAQEQELPLGVFARSWAGDLADGRLMSVGVFSVAGCLMAALFAPLTGATTTSLVPTEDLLAIRPSVSHRFFDALIINAVSGLGVLQLLTLTSIASLITMDGLRTPALLASWAIWVLLICTMTAWGFTLELLTRRLGRATKWGLAGGVILIVGVAVLLDPLHGATLFGLGDLFVRALRLGVHGWSFASALLPLVLVAVSLAVVVCGATVTRIALGIMPPPARTRAARPVKVTSKRFLGLALITARLLWKTPEVRRPMASLMFVGTILIVFAPMDTNILFSVIAAVSLSMSLAWASNFFGLLGTGMAWLASLPGVMRRLPAVHMAVFMGLGYTLLGAITLAGALAGKVDARAALLLTSCGGLSLAATGSVSLLLSVWNPKRARLSGRGDALIPPLTALGYLGLILIVGPMPVFFLLLSDFAPVILMPSIASLAAVVVVSLAAATWAWRSPLRQSRVIATTRTA